jgi:hypothetical protein
MGYRSGVVLYVGPEVMPQFMVTMAKSQAARTMCFDEHTERVKDYGDEKGSMLFHFDQIKWYNTYEEIQAIEDFMDWCENEHLPGKNSDGEEVTIAADEHFRFVRTGENMDDSETRGWGMCDSIEIVRAIQY